MSANITPYLSIIVSVLVDHEYPRSDNIPRTMSHVTDDFNIVNTIRNICRAMTCI